MGESPQLCLWLPQGAGILDRIPLQRSLCSICYVNIKVRESLTLVYLQGRTILLQKEEKNLNYYLKSEWDSKICMELILKIRIFFFSWLGQERLVCHVYIQLEPTPVRFLQLGEDLCVGNS